MDRLRNGLIVGFNCGMTAFLFSASFSLAGALHPAALLPSSLLFSGLSGVSYSYSSQETKREFLTFLCGASYGILAALFLFKFPALAANIAFSCSDMLLC
nr:transmembrane domain-containing protein [Marseillevirus sp.]